MQNFILEQAKVTESGANFTEQGAQSETVKIQGFYSEIVTNTIQGLMEKWFLLARKMFTAGMCLFWKLMEYKDDHSLDACTIPTFQNKFL